MVSHTQTTSKAVSLQGLLAWLGSPTQIQLGRDQTIEWYLLMHPKVVFLKNLPLNSTVFDIGAGDGRLSDFRGWLGFPRNDLRLQGASLFRPELADRYDEFYVCDIEAHKPALKAQPTAVIAAQLIEHLQRPWELVDWLSHQMPQGSRLYLDWPSPLSLRLPSLVDLLAAGYDVSTVNFYDDASHIQTFSLEQVVSICDAKGFEYENGGVIRLPYLAEALRAQGLDANNTEDERRFFLTAAIWLYTGFVTYASFVKRSDIAL